MATITKEFLEEALTEAVDSFQVTPGSNAGDGYACIIYSVDVIRKGKPEEPIHLIVKCFPTHPGRQAWLTESNMFRKELLAYNILIPELLRFQTNKGSIYSANDGFERIIKPPFPHFYFGQAVDYKAENGKFLDVLALYFCDVKQPSDPSINKDNILRVPQDNNPNEEPWLTITHGDSWLNNMMFRYDEETGKPLEVLFIDLQLTREADPFVDLAYALYTSTNAELRQQHLEELLKLYNLTFIQICEHYKVIPPTGFQLSEVRRRFHRAKALGMATAIQGLPLFLNDPNHAVDLETTLGSGQDEIGVAFAEMVQKVVENPEFVKRVMGLLRELRREGVI
ncbi:unnamed protein product [Allacma fusca]|uniref:CHK kinase-like domain-containing protein n=1 Tax=Allacma fusca TaxID=39272 RepID=A0A8J2LUP9_9HEXA|nr:unnamed protein product [Allacma fusca]